MGPAILVIEDEAIVASDLQRFLGSTGYRVVGPVASRAGALSRITTNKLDGALLDLQLAGDVAEVLQAANIPHIFINGWGIGPSAERYRDQPVLNNPYDYHSLLNALSGAIGDKGPHAS